MRRHWAVELVGVLFLAFVCEVGVYQAAIWRCAPQEDPETEVCEPSQILVVSDTQLTDGYSYAMRARWGWIPGYVMVEQILEWACDMYIRSALTAVASVGPRLAAAVDLGDVLDGGRYYTVDEWKRGVSRIQALRSVAGRSLPWFTVPGNHDVDIDYRMKTHRFEASLGLGSRLVVAGNMSIILLNSMALRASTPSALRMATEAFLASEELVQAPAPRLLMLHQPLYRPPTATCGPLRNAGGSQIPYVVRGRNYATQALPEVTERILDKLAPLDAVLSGDDHEPCVYQHAGDKEAGPVEYTLPTLSWLQGSFSPGLAFIALERDAGNCAPKAVTVAYCFLPNRYITLGVYVAAAALLAKLRVDSAYAFGSPRVSRLKKTDAEASINERGVSITRSRCLLLGQQLARWAVYMAGYTGAMACAMAGVDRMK